VYCNDRSPKHGFSVRSKREPDIGFFGSPVRKLPRKAPRFSLPPPGHEVQSPMWIEPKQAQPYGVELIMMDRTVDLLVIV
jgi:hypothetical protein